MPYNEPPCSLVTESGNLPDEAKPAEVRENIAISLTHASGSWVLPYIVRALAEEERSQRCRLELARQLAAREKSIGVWLATLRGGKGQQWRTRSDGLENSVSKLRDISAALADAVRKNQTLTPCYVCGPYLAKASCLAKVAGFKPREDAPELSAEN